MNVSKIKIQLDFCNINSKLNLESNIKKILKPIPENTFGSLLLYIFSTLESLLNNFSKQFRAAIAQINAYSSYPKCHLIITTNSIKTEYLKLRS